MRNLSPEQTYWLSLISIVGASLLLGYLIGFARAWKRGYDDGWHDHDDVQAPAVKRLHFTDFKTPPTWVTDEDPSSLTADHRPLTTGLEVHS